MCFLETDQTAALYFPRDFSINLKHTEKLLKHSPQSDFRAENFFDFKNFKSFLNFNLRLKNVQINFSIHFNFSNTNRTAYFFNCFPYPGDGCTWIFAKKLNSTAVSMPFI